MSKYGPAWVWFATGQSLGQTTPSSTLHRRGCQPQSAPSIHATPAVLPSSAAGNRSGAGTRAEPTQRKGGYGKLWGPPEPRMCPQMQQSSLTHGRRVQSSGSRDQTHRSPNTLSHLKGDSCTPGKLRREGATYPRPGWGTVASQGSEPQGRVEVSQCSLTHKACSPQTGPACPSVL